MPPQSVPLSLVKGYRELRRQLQSSYQIADEASPVLLQTCFVDAPNVLATSISALALQRSLSRVRQLLLESDLRSIYTAAKQRAKQKLRDKYHRYKAYASHAVDTTSTNMARYLSNSEASTSGASSYAAALGTGGMRAAAPNAAVMSGPAQSLPTSSTAAVSGAVSASGHELGGPSIIDSSKRIALPDDVYGPNGYLRKAVIYLVGNASRIYMQTLNTTTFSGLEHMEAALQRPTGQPLITVSNHVAAMDDPLVVSNVVPPQYLGKPEAMRWTLCATDRCFKYRALIPFFQAAKVLPVERGAGMSQRGMAAAEDRLAAGDWVHIFPEGTRSKDGKVLGAVRKGVGRLVAACPTPPLVVPWVHGGMENVMPRGAPVPRVGNEVRVLVGAPVPVADLMHAAAAHGWSEDQLYSSLAARIGTHLRALKHELDTGEKVEIEYTAPAAVSGLDLFDPSDLPAKAALQARLTGMWERAKFRMQARARGIADCTAACGSWAMASMWQYEDVMHAVNSRSTGSSSDGYSLGKGLSPSGTAVQNVSSAVSTAAEGPMRQLTLLAGHVMSSPSIGSMLAAASSFPRLSSSGPAGSVAPSHYHQTSMAGSANWLQRYAADRQQAMASLLCQ